MPPQSGRQGTHLSVSYNLHTFDAALRAMGTLSWSPRVSSFLG
jgi:hypothetical protein